MTKKILQARVEPTSRGARSARLQIAGIPSSKELSGGARAVITFGVFDPVHAGNLWLASKVVDRAKELHTQSIVILFRPSPAEAIGYDSRNYFTALPDVLQIMRSLGVSHVGVLNFTLDLATMSASKFLLALMTRVPFCELWQGEGASVGRGPEGSQKSVVDIGQRLGFASHYVSAPSQITSNDVRECAENLGFERYPTLSGRHYSLYGYVEPLTYEDHGVPAGIFIPPQRMYVPRDGVYAVLVEPIKSESVLRPVAGPTANAIAHISTARDPANRTQILLYGVGVREHWDTLARVNFLANIPPQISALATQLCS